MCTPSEILLPNQINLTCTDLLHIFDFSENIMAPSKRINHVREKLLKNSLFKEKREGKISI